MPLTNIKLRKKTNTQTNSYTGASGEVTIDTDKQVIVVHDGSTAGGIPLARDCQGWQGSNPFEIEKVKSFIKRDLDMLYQGQYEIQVVPNITNITYGRDVGYKIEQETFDEKTHAISATNIRKALGL